MSVSAKIFIQTVTRLTPKGIFFLELPHIRSLSVRLTSTDLSAQCIVRKRFITAYFTYAYR